MINRLIDESFLLLQQQGVETSKFELRMLLGHILGIEPAEVMFYKQPLTAEQKKIFDEFVALRATHYPADKIIGKKGFYKFDFIVNTDVLSPRPETEILVEKAIELIRTQNLTSVLEFGVGSGCVILSILAECPSVCGTGIDISEKALNVAKQNAAALEISSARLSLKNVGWFDCDIISQIGSGFDIIVSNPPYIPSSEIAELDREVKEFDPLTALDGGKDGMRDYRQISALAQQILSPGGYLLFEGGFGQAAEIQKIGEENGLFPVETIMDLNHTERCIILKK